MENLEAFRKAVKEYTRQAQREIDGRPATMEDLATNVGFTRETLSKKLNGRLSIDAYDVRNIVRGLAKLDAITSRNQAKYLLNLMNAPDFEMVDWDSDPLRKLEAKITNKLDEMTEESGKLSESTGQYDVPVRETFIESPPEVQRVTERVVGEQGATASQRSVGEQLGEGQEPQVGPQRVTERVVGEQVSEIQQKPLVGEQGVQTEREVGVKEQTTPVFHPQTLPKPVRRPPFSWRMSVLLVSVLILLLLGFLVVPPVVSQVVAGNSCPIPTNSQDAKEIYVLATCSKRHLITDPLSSPDAYGWDQNKRCVFQDGAYHVFVEPEEFVYSCFAHKLPSIRNLALQVKMTIVRGGSGGLAFRSETTTGWNLGTIMYRVPFEKSGTYNFYLGVDVPCNGIPSSSPKWCQSAGGVFHRGLGQENTITIIALDDMVYLYSNGLFVDSAKSRYAETGYLGVFANTYQVPAEVAFRDLKLWTWPDE